MESKSSKSSTLSPCHCIAIAMSSLEYMICLVWKDVTKKYVPACYQKLHIFWQKCVAKATGPSV